MSLGAIGCWSAMRDPAGASPERCLCEETASECGDYDEEGKDSPNNDWREKMAIVDRRDACQGAGRFVL